MTGTLTRKLCLALGAMLLSVSAAPSQSATSPLPRWLGKRTALLVGTDSYSTPEWAHLSSPVRDAEALGKSLSNAYGFDASVLRNPSKAELQKAIIAAKNSATGPNDWTVIFIASHGFFDDDRNQGYLVTRDSRARQSDVTLGSYFPLAELLPMIEGFRNGHVLLVLDACYAGTIDRDIASGTNRGGALTSRERRVVEQYAARRAQYASREFLTSGGKEYVPDGDPGAHSPFAGALLGILRDASAEGLPLTLDQIRGELAAAAIQPVPRHGVMRGQEPGGDFVFVPLSFLSSATVASAGTSSGTVERVSSTSAGEIAHPSVMRSNIPPMASSPAEAAALLGRAERSFQALEASCNAGTVEDCSLAAQRVLRAHGVSRDVTKAQALYSRGCAGGSAAACAQGQVLAARDASQSSAADAARSELRQNCDSGEPYACAGLARLWLGGGAGGSPGELSGILADSCRQGLAASCAWAALAQPRAGGHIAAQGEELLETGCKALDLDSCAFLAQVYVERDSTSAEVLLGTRLATATCNRYHPIACNLLSRQYEFGIGDDAPDLRLARQFAERACDARSAEGCFLLGRSQLIGLGGERDRGAAAKNFELACSLGLHADCSRPLTPATEIDWWRAVP